MFKKLTAFFLTFILASLSVVNVNALDITSGQNFSPEALNDYFTLINGCSQAALKNYEDDEYVEGVVYSGLDITNPQIIFHVTMFYFSNGVDFEKLTSDAVYSTNLADRLDSYLAEKGIINTKSSEFLKKYNMAIKDNLKLKFPTLGAYTFRTKKQNMEKMLDDESTDFVIAGSVFMLKKGDINSDGKINNNDAVLIQEIIAKNYSYTNSDEEQFIQYSSDLNEDGVLNVNDVTVLQQTI